VSFPGTWGEVVSSPDAFDPLEVDFLVAKYWDDFLDGDRTNLKDLDTFIEPFQFTRNLQYQA
jgi:hypothetical protein